MHTPLARRSFAAQADAPPKGSEVAARFSFAGIPGRYAAALFNVATRAGTLDAVQKELAQVRVCNEGGRRAALGARLGAVWQGRRSGRGGCQRICAPLARPRSGGVHPPTTRPRVRRVSMRRAAPSAQVAEASTKNAQFRQYLRDPTVPKAVKLPVLRDILKGLGVSEITQHFVATLVDNGRVKELDKILAVFGDILVTPPACPTCARNPASPLRARTTRGSEPHAKTDPVHNCYRPFRSHFPSVHVEADPVHNCCRPFRSPLCVRRRSAARSRPP